MESNARLRTYAISLGALIVAVALRLALYPILGDTLPFITLFAAVAVAVWAGGAVHAVLVSTLGYLILTAFFWNSTERPRSIAENLVSLIVYMVTFLIVVAFGETMRRAQRVSRQAENDARHQQNMLRLTLKSIGDAVITTDAGGRVTYINPVASALTGWAPDEARSQPLSSVFRVFDEQTREPVANPAEKVMQIGRAVGLAGHTVLVRRDGTERTIDETAAPIRDQQGGTIGVVLVFHDITDQRESEKQLRRTQQELTDFFENAAVGMHWMKSDGTIVRVNQTELAMLGYGSGEYLGHNIAEFHVDPNVAGGILARLARGEAIINQEARLRCRDGSTRTVLIHSNVYEEDGKFIHTRTLTHDITALKEAQEALRRSEERLRLAQGGARIGTFEWDLRTGIISATPELEAMYGFPPGLYPGSLGEWERLVHPDDREYVMREVSASLESGSLESEWRVPWLDGTDRWVAGRATVFRDEDGKPLRMIGINIDITELKRAEQALKNADRQKDQFLATLAHELRNPLAPLRNSLEVMKQASGNLDVIEHARSTMERQVTQLVRLIDDLLDVSRITHDRLELRKDRVELASIIHHAVESCRPMLEQSGHDFSFELPSQPVYLRADPVRIAQVFGNLLTNACKYTEPGGRIRLEVTLDETHIVARVSDSGVGIPREMLPRVFDMFTQIDHSLVRSQGGLGIGLALVKRLVELHDGTITASSQGPGRGSEFVVRLPVDAGQDAAVLAPEPVDETVSNTTRRVLVVDDNQDAAMSLAMLLEMFGREAMVANDGASALEQAESFRPDVMLLDIGMPVMNGYDVCRAVRAKPWGNSIIMIALTGWGQDEDRRKSKEAGFDMHLVKPVAPADLRKVLAEL